MVGCVAMEGGNVALRILLAVRVLITDAGSGRDTNGRLG
jgi:hypothetical protein